MRLFFAGTPVTYAEIERFEAEVPSVARLWSRVHAWGLRREHLKAASVTSAGLTRLVAAGLLVVWVGRPLKCTSLRCVEALRGGAVNTVPNIHQVDESRQMSRALRRRTG